MNSVSSLERVKIRSKAAWNDLLVRRGVKAIGCLLLLNAIAIVAMISRVPPEIPLHFSRPWGIMQLVPSYVLWWLFAAEVCASIIHTVAAFFIFQKHDTLARMLLWAGFFVIVLVSISIGTVYLRVGQL